MLSCTSQVARGRSIDERASEWVSEWEYHPLQQYLDIKVLNHLPRHLFLDHLSAVLRPVDYKGTIVQS